MEKLGRRTTSIQLAELHGRLSTEVFADYVPGARV
jgi:hypothetical protein